MLVDLPGYGFALAAPEAVVARKPDSLSHAVAGAMPLVALTSFQSALGEATLLALAARPDEGGVSAWSSGTGSAGIVGYGGVWLFTRALRVSSTCSGYAPLSPSW